MKKVTLSEELAQKIGYKSLKGLKLSISRKLGKGAYTKDLEIQIIKLVAVAAKE